MTETSLMSESSTAIREQVAAAACKTLAAEIDNGTTVKSSTVSGPAMVAADFISAARVPESLKPQEFGLWAITRARADQMQGLGSWFIHDVGFSSYTMLRRVTMETMHQPPELGEVVMDDSTRELRRHLPIWLNAKGRVLVTGLGLGCVVRGLLAAAAVEHVTVIEIDRDILRVVGSEFESDPRVRLVLGDALEAEFPGERFDFAWHDIWTEGDRSLHVLHMRLIQRFYKQCRIQWAWQFPRCVKRSMPGWFLR